MKQNYLTKSDFNFRSVLMALFSMVFALFFSWDVAAQTDSKTAAIAGSEGGGFALSALVTCDGGPCDAIRWNSGATWNLDGSINDLPNAPAPNGIVRCGSSAETQSNIPTNSCYNPASVPGGGIFVNGIPCIDASLQSYNYNVTNPIAGQSMIWFNWDVRAYANSFELQVNNPNQVIGWALFYSTAPTTSVGPNGLSGNCNSIAPVLNDDPQFAGLNYILCGVQSSNTWNSIPVPDFPNVSNYYLAVWRQGGGTFSLNNFKARFGCGEVPLCNVDITNVETTCNDDGTYTAAVTIFGINGEYKAYDANAINPNSNSICLTNIGVGGPINGILYLTYPVGTPYNITVSEVSPSTIGGCNNPSNSATCTESISGNSPLCCNLEVVCPPTNTYNISCIGDIPPVNPSQFTIINPCGAIDISSEIFVNNGDGCPGNPKTITRQYTVTDGVTTIQCEDVFIIENNVAPTFNQPPANVSVQCIADVPAPVALGYTDNCLGNGTVMPTDQSNGQTCPETITRTWSYTDPCGVTITATQLITINDNINPVIVPVANVNLQGCNADWPSLSTTWSDNCGGSGTINGIPGQVMTNGCTQTLVYTFSVTDACGNPASTTASVTRTYDVTNPTIAAIANYSLQGCNANWPTLTTTWSDNCSEGGEITASAGDVVTNGCIQSRVYTFSVTDACGNPATSTTTVSRTYDVTNPTIAAIANYSLQGCNANWPTLTTTWSDNCSEGGEITASAGDVVTNGCTQSRVYTFSVTDACGNPATSTTTVSRTYDVTNPTIAAIANYSLQGCNANWPTLTTTWSDNCSEGGEITASAGDVVTNGCTQSRVYTFSVTDACGNPATSTTTVSRTYDVTLPTINAPADYVLDGCNAEWPAVVQASWTDNCSQGGTINGVAGSVTTDGCSQFRTYSFSVMDACGNTAIASTVVTRFYNESNPVIQPIANYSLQGCNANWPTLVTTWTSDCAEGGNVTATAGDVVTNGCTQSRVYTFTVNDDCGNSATSNTTVTRTYDVTNPTIVAIANYSLQGCNANWPTLTTTWSDNCSEGGEITASAGDVVTNGCTQSRVYTFSVTDACGNPATSTTTVSRTYDVTNPTIAAIANYSLQGCNANWPTLTTTWSDNCSEGGEITASAGDVVTNGCTQSRVYTFSVTDACGNPATSTTTVSRTYDVTNPTIAAIANYSLQGCNANWPTLTTTWSDNCSEGGEITASAGDVVTNGCTQSRVYTFSVTDACGNPATSTTTVSRTYDVTNPTIAAIANYSLQGCNANWPTLTTTWSDNCSEGGEITASAGDVITNGCTQSRVYTFSVTDACGNPATSTTTVTRTYDVTNPTIVAIANYSIEGCSDSETSWPTLSTTWSDNCSEGGTIWATAGDVTSNGCSQSRVYTFSVTDACGNPATSTTTVSRFYDVVDPIITCPADLNVDCYTDVPAANINMVDYSDNCSNVTVTWQGDVEEGDECAGTITRTYRATDACGNWAECVQIITYADTIAPIFLNIPENLTLDCTEDVPSAEELGVTDNCNNFDLTWLDEQPEPEECQLRTQTQGGWGAPANGNNPGTYRNANFAAAFPNGLTVGCNGGFTLTLTSASAVQAFLPSGGTPAVLTQNWVNPNGSFNNTFAGQITALALSIGFDANDPNFGPSESLLADAVINNGPFTGMTVGAVFAIANDVFGGCSNAYSASQMTGVLGMINENFVGGTANLGNVDCEPNFLNECAYTIIRTYTATDACGNTSSITQTITVTDLTPPTITCAEGGNYECVTDVPAANINSVVASDNCNAVSVTLEFENVVGNDCSGTVVRIYRATDACGNYAECTQMITYSDTQAPTFNEEIVDITVQCPDDVPPFEECTATDNCDNDVQVWSFESSNLIGEETCILTTAFGPGVDWSIWLADLPGASDYYNFTNGGTMQVFGDGSALITGTVTASNNANQIFNVFIRLENKRNWDEWSALGRDYKDDALLAGNNYLDWMYYELDGNNSFLVGAGDFAGSILNLTHMPANFLFGFQCGVAANNKNANFGMSGWFFYNGFLNGTAVSGAGDVNVDKECGPNQENLCAYTIERNWFAMDDCGNMTSASQTITVADTQAPEFTVVPEDLFFDCIADVPAADVSQLEAEDNCTNVTITHEGDIQTGDDCEAVIIRTYQAIDDCGNFVKHYQTITVADETAPTFTFVPGNINVECDQQIPFVNATATDNCGDVTITHSDSNLLQDECLGYYIRTFTAVDECGNTAIATQTINIVDTTAPTFNNPPANTTASCDNVPAVADVTASDNCGDATVTVVETLFSGGCVGVIQRIFTATDECGNTAVHEQYITLVDTIAPVLANLPANATYECNVGAPAPANVTATDNCDSSVIVVFNETQEAGDCPQEYTIFRTWSAVDTCENAVSYTQVITITDETAPEFTWVPENLNVQCPEDVPAPDELTATDNCDENVTVTFLEVEGPQSYASITTAIGDGYALSIPTFIPGSQNYVFNSEGTFTQFNNGTARLQGTVFSTIYPAKGWAVDIWLKNKAGWDEWNNAGGVFVDDNNLVNNDEFINWDFYVIDADQSRLDGLGDYEGFYLNLSQAAFPVNTGFQVGEIANNRNTNWGMYTRFYTNGYFDGQNVLGWGNIFLDGTQGPELSNECSYDITRIWTATDDCGNSTTVEQTIHVEDTTAPVFTMVPQAINVECGQAVPVTAAMATDNCGDVTITYTDSNLLPDNCAGYYVRTFTAVDACGNSATATQNINIIDTTAPVITACPADASYSCLADVPAANTALVSATDVCSDVTIVLHSEVSTGNDCQGTIVRTYRAIDACGNFSNCVQVINYNDNVAPTFDNAPANMVASCDNVPAVEEVTASDNCGDATVTVVETLFSGGCVGVIQRIFTATDECGNTAVHEQYITLVDTIAPVLANLPANATYECNVGAPAPANVTATDNCDSSVIVVFNETQEAGDCPQEYTIFRTWSAVDTCENAVSYTQVITITDNTAPTFNVENSEITVACDFVVDVVTPVATDNCDTTPTVTVASSSTPGECANEWTEMYTWTATDDCGNSSSVSLTINYVDEVAPVFTMVPQAINVECGQAVPVTAAMATDNCGDVTITYTDSNLLPDNCAGYYVRTFTAVDACGNSATATQNINIIDTTAPVITACPADASYSCLADVPAANTALVSATDVCSDVTIVLHSEVSDGDDCEGVIIRTYRATDACGNFADCVQVINYNDNVAPTFDNAPANMVASCDNVPAVEEVTASDNCGDATVTVVETLFSGGCVGVIQRIFTATDECGNTAVHEQYITLVDTIAPVLANLPANATYECNVGAPAPANVTATDNCDSSVIVVFNETQEAGDCPQEYTIFRTWSAVDTCENAVSYTQVITITDNTAPTFNVENSEITVACDFVVDVVTPVATDNCDTTPTVTVASSSTPGECANEWTEMYTWTATDDCGNSSSVSLTINYVDEVAPVFTMVPQAINVECGQAVPVTAAMATDNCGDVTITYTDSNLLPDNCAGYYVRTFTAVDACGNSATATQNINIIDTTAPVITACPADASYSCLADVPAANTALVSATDVCSDVTIVLHSEVATGNDCQGTIVRTYRATDACGNFSNCVQVINYNDNVAPTFDNAPANMVASCDNVPAVADVTASDNCGDATVTVVETLFSGGCVGVIQRIFTATDECGNTAVHEQYITLVDTIAPVLANLPGDMEMECSDKMPFVPNVTATDNCDSSVNVIYSQTIQEGDCANNYTILRTWTATDTCNNSVSHTQVISVSDNTAPIIVAIPSFTLQGCNPEWPALATTWTDNCSEGGVVNGVAGQVVTNGCSQSRVYTFSVADECGNAASTTTTVTRTYDVTAPVIAAIADYTLQGCNPEWPSLTTTWTDNCSEGGSLTAAVGDVVTNGCSQSRVYTFNVIDACGNPATSSTTVTRTYDVVAPVITCPATVQVDCYDDVPAANVNSVSVSDACSSVTVTWEGDAEQGDSCEGTIIRTYRATDACGNFAECVQIINYSDNDAPVFVDAPADATYTCDDEIPALEDCIAVDNCSSNITYTSVEYIEGYTGEDGLRQCTLTTPFNVLGQPWAVWLPNSIGEPQYYYLSAEGGQFVELPNGRAHLTGTVYATNNPNKRWIIDVYFKDRADWTTWSGLGRSYKDDALVAGNLYQNWDYYIMNADSAVLVGDGLYAGANLALTHMPASYYFGFQVGEAANNRNAADGMSGWFFYSGTWNNSAVTGIGDFGFEKECPECDYTITRIWTATDECGNEATAVQVITVQPADTDLEGGITEQQIGRTAGVTLAAWPNPTAHKSTINFNVPFGGQVMLEVFNMDGKLIETLYRGEVMAGQDYYLPFNAESLSNGIYLYKLTTEKSTYIDKLMLAK
jgi:large repetitive protein